MGRGAPAILLGIRDNWSPKTELRLETGQGGAPENSSDLENSVFRKSPILPSVRPSRCTVVAVVQWLFSALEWDSNVIRVLAENLVWVGLPVVCFLYKINPNPRKFICCGKKWSKCHVLTSIVFLSWVGLGLGSSSVSY